MNTATTFDTLEFTEDLKNAGIKENEAKAIVKLMKRAQESANADFATKQEIVELRHANDNANLATKMDIARLESKLESKIVEMKSDLEGRIAETKADLTKWVVTVGVLQFALISALLLKIVD